MSKYRKNYKKKKQVCKKEVQNSYQTIYNHMQEIELEPQ